MRNKNLKRFLTTASALGMIAIGAQSASAAPAQSAVGNVTHATATIPDVAGVLYTLSHNGAIINFNDPAARATAIGVAAGITPAATSTINTAALTLTAVSNDDTANAALGSVALTFGTASTLTLNGAGAQVLGGGLGFATAIVANAATTYNKLGAVDFANTASTMIVSANNVTLAGTILSTASAGAVTKGVLNVTGHDNIFSGNLGDSANSAGGNNAIGAINVSATTGITTFSGANKVMVGAVTLSNAGNVTFTGGAGVKVMTGNFDASASTGTVNVTAALLVDSGNVLLGTGVTTFGATVTATKGSINTGNAVTGITGNAAAYTTITTGTGRLTAGGTLLATNNGANAIAIKIGAGGATVTGMTTATAGDLDLTTTTAASTFTGGITTTAGGNFNTGAGAVSTGNVASTVDGTVTTLGGKLSLVGAAADFTVTNSASKNTAMAIGTGGAAFGRDLIITKGNIDLSADTSGTAVTRHIAMNGAAGQSIIVGAGAGGANAGLTVGGNITFANAGTINLAGNQLTLAGAAGRTVTKADIVTNTVNTGTLVANGANNLTILSNIGATGSTILAINTITATGAGTVTIGDTVGNNSTVTTVAAKTTTIDNGTTLAINSAGNSIAYFGTIDSFAINNNSVLNINGAPGKVVTFNNAIGSTFAIKTLNHGTAAQGDAIYNDVVKTTGDITAARGSVVVFNKAVNAGGALTIGGVAASSVTFNDVAVITGVASLDNGSTLTFAKDATITGGTITLTAAGDKLNVMGNLHGGIVAAGKGTATFGNGARANITVDSSGANGIGTNAAAVTTVVSNLAGGTLTVGGVGGYNAANTTFTTDDTLVLTAVDTNRLGIVTTAVAGSGGTIIINQPNFATTGNIGKSGYGIKELKLANAVGKMTVTAGDILYANVTTGSANTGEVDFAGASPSPALNIGTAAAPLLQVTGAGNAVVVGTIYAKNIATGAGGITADAFNATVATDVTGGTATVNDKGTIGKVIGAGTLTLSGAATVSGPIGATGASLTALNIAGASPKNVVTFQDPTTFAATVNHGVATLDLKNATTINTAAYNATGSTFNIYDNALAIVTPVMKISGNITVNMSMGARSAVFTGVTAMDAATAGNEKVTLNISSGGGLSAGAQLINLFESPAGLALTATTAANALTHANVTLGASSNRFISGLDYIDTPAAVAASKAAATALGASASQIAAITTGQLVVQSSVTTDKLASATITPGASDFVKQLVSQFNDGSLVAGSDAAKYVQSLGDLTLEDSTKSVTAVSDRSVADVGNNVAGSAVNAATQAMTTRLDVTSGSNVAFADSGVASGDNADKFGVWGQVIGGTATQRVRKNVSGFQSRMVGILVGGDTMISDKVTVGVIAGNSMSNVKHKDTKSGDKTKANSWIFGLYGSYDRIADTDFFTQSNLTIAQTSIDAKEGRISTPAVAGGAGSKQTARAKYDILGVAAEVVGGYKFMFDNSYVAPTVGLRYNYFGDTSYTQTGTTNQNLKVSTKATSVVSGLAGVKLGSSVDMDGTNIMPEVHANLSYAFNSPSAKTNFAISGMKDVAYRGPKAAKFGANFGAGVMAEAEGFEYGVGYDANIGDKYLAHQGSLKVKVKF